MSDRGSWPFVSVIVVTKNRAASLERTLEALTQLDYPDYEIIVVDNGSTDGTPKVVKRFPARYTLRLEANISLCRQQGVNLAQGELIAMCDDDCIPASKWLKQLVSRLVGDDNIALVAGQVVNIGFPQGQRFKGRGKIGRNGILTFTADPSKADYFGSANMAFKRTAFQAIGGYDPFFRGGYEEADLILRLKRAGFRVVYEPQALVEHHFTGVSYKLKAFYGGSLMRLYFYLKHFRPRTVKEWVSFLGYELWLLGKELFGVGRQLGRTALRGEFRRWPRIGLRLFNSVSARLALPWVIWKAAQRCKIEQPLWEKR